MTYQRRRGLPATIYRSKTVPDSRGNMRKVVDEDNPHEIKAWIMPERSARAEVPGDQQINVMRIGTKWDLADVDLWSHVHFLGRNWDVVEPPAYHYGASRATRHWSIVLRERV